MLSRTAALTIISCVALTGCTSMFNAKAAKWPWPEDKKICASATCTETESLNAFLQASSFCRDVQNYYESGGQRSNGLKVGVGAVGAVAGGVFAPVANGTAATAWSGLSGATNALQISMDEAFSSAVSIKRRASVAKAADDGAIKYTNATDPADEIVAAINMARLCAMGSATADQSVMKAISVPE